MLKMFPTMFPTVYPFSLSLLKLIFPLKMATITIVLRTDRINKKGEAPINFFVVKHRKLTKVATGLMIDPKFWDDKNKRVKGTHKNSGRMNSFLASKLADLNDNVLEQEHFQGALPRSRSRKNFMVKLQQTFLNL